MSCHVKNLLEFKKMYPGYLLEIGWICGHPVRRMSCFQAVMSNEAKPLRLRRVFWPPDWLRLAAAPLPCQNI